VRHECDDNSKTVPIRQRAVSARRQGTADISTVNGVLGQERGAPAGQDRERVGGQPAGQAGDPPVDQGAGSRINQGTGSQIDQGDCTTIGPIIGQAGEPTAG
jgi:hypothetical protein